MPFNPPGIIGGGRLVSPAVTSDPFKGINDAITRARDRKLKEKALQLQAFQVYAEAEKNYAGEGEFPGFQEWYKTNTQNPDESQASIGGFFGMLGDVAMAPIAKIGKIGKDLFTQGETAATKEIQAVVNQKNEANASGGDLDLSNSDSSDPVKQQNQIKSENEGKLDKYLADKANNLTTANDSNLVDEGSWYDHLLDMPSSREKYATPTEEPKEEKKGQWWNPFNARGGKIPGNRTGDKNKAYLEDGEYVLNRNAVDGLGKGFLDYINNERYPRFQTGGFNDPEVIEGRIVDPTVVETPTGGGSGGGGFLSAMIGGGQSGGYVHNHGYQAGGFMAPGIQSGNVAQMAAPSAALSQGIQFKKKEEEEEEEDKPGTPPPPGEEKQGLMGKATSAVGSFFGFQRGGSVSNNPGPAYPWTPEPDARRRNFQSGGYMSQQRANYLQDQRNKEAMSDFRKAKDRYNVGVNKQEMEMDEYQKNLSSGLSGAGLWTADLLTPDWMTGPLLSLYYGTDVEDIEDIPRALADQSKAEYAKTYMREEMEAPFGEGVQPTAEMLAEKQAYAGTPNAPLTTRLSNDALKREAQKAMGNFNIEEWLQSQYGDNWWTSLHTNPMGN